MESSKTHKKGDISIFLTIMVSTIMLIMLSSIVNKSLKEVQLNRQNLNSQQALQAANTGLDEWQYLFKRGLIDISSGSNPNTNLPTGENQWKTLSTEVNTVIEYRVEYEIVGSMSKIIATGRVTENGQAIIRSLEVTF